METALRLVPDACLRLLVNSSGLTGWEHAVSRWPTNLLIEQCQAGG